MLEFAKKYDINERKLSVRDTRIILMGASGSGKTTLASSYPNVLYIDLDGGMVGLTGAASCDVLGVDVFVDDANSSAAGKVELAVDEACSMPVDDKGNRKYWGIAIDTLDKLYDHAERDCKNSIANKYEVYPEIYKRLRALVTRCYKAHMTLILVCQQKMVDITDLDTDKETKKLYPALTNKFGEKILRDVDHIVCIDTKYELQPDNTQKVVRFLSGKTTPHREQKSRGNVYNDNIRPDWVEIDKAYKYAQAQIDKIEKDKTKKDEVKK